MNSSYLTSVLQFAILGRSKIIPVVMNEVQLVLGVDIEGDVTVLPGLGPLLHSGVLCLLNRQKTLLLERDNFAKYIFNL